MVGDVHGHLAKLQALLPRLYERAQPGDCLVFVGDYVDRGPDSRGVIDLVLEQADGAWDGPVVTLMGNHEEMMLDYVSGAGRYDPEIWLENGGTQTIASYAGPGRSRGWMEQVPAEHLEFLEALGAWHQDENGIYVHAGIPPGRRPEEVPESTLRWIRNEFIESDYQWDRVVVFGHTPQYEEERGRFRFLEPARLRWRPLDRPEKIGIDTGAAYGGPLTAVVLPERDFITLEPDPE